MSTRAFALFALMCPFRAHCVIKVFPRGRGDIIAHRIASHRITSHPIALHRIASHRIQLHRIPYNRIASHRISFHALHRIALQCIASHRILNGHPGYATKITIILHPHRARIRGEAEDASEAYIKKVTRVRVVRLEHANRNTERESSAQFRPQGPPSYLIIALRR